MANILVIFATDALPIVARLQSMLQHQAANFFRVEDSTNQLRSELALAIKNANICLLVSSRQLANILSDLRGSETFAAQDTKFFQLQLGRQLPAEAELWRRLFSAVFDPVFHGEPLLGMSSGEQDFKLNELADFLRQYRQPNLRQEWSPRPLSRDFREDGPLPPPDPRVVELLFATNRSSVVTAETMDFSGEREDQLTFGSSRVRIPEDHKIGQLELPKQSNWIRLRFSAEAEDPNRHFVLQGVNVFDKDEFTEIVGSDRSHTAIVFTHGFNTSFKEGVFRLAQIVWDMQFRGVPILFSWPSRGGVLNYLYDFNSALGARAFFASLIKLLRTDGKVETLHIIAHSMGTFIVLEALNELARLGTMPKVAEIVMAAPDVDVDLFHSLARSLRPFARGMTLYASANDKALVTSRGIARRPRAGDVFADGPILIEDMESIDVSEIGNEMFGLNHSVFASDRSLIDDIGSLVLNGTRPPSRRSHQIRGVPEGIEPPRYWRYPR